MTYIRKLRESDPGYGTKLGNQFPWLVLRSHTDHGGRAFPTWDKAIKYATRRVML